MLKRELPERRVVELDSLHLPLISTTYIGCANRRKCFRNRRDKYIDAHLTQP